MFLASTTEVGLANENGIAEGSKLALFSDNTSRLAYCTQAAIDKSNYGSDPTTSQAWYWWLRTPHSGYSYVVRYVNTSGALSDGSASRRAASSRGLTEPKAIRVAVRSKSGMLFRNSLMFSSFSIEPKRISTASDRLVASD